MLPYCLDMLSTIVLELYVCNVSKVISLLEFNYKFSLFICQTVCTFGTHPAKFYLFAHMMCSFPWISHFFGISCGNTPNYHVTMMFFDRHLKYFVTSINKSLNNFMILYPSILWLTYKVQYFPGSLVLQSHYSGAFVVLRSRVRRSLFCHSGDVF